MSLSRPKLVDGVALRIEKNGDQEIRVYTPNKPLSGAALLLIHGGGLIMGAPKHVDWLASWYAQKLGATVISPGYRLAPDHAAPAAIDDCYDAWNWLLASADKYRIDKDKIAVGGVSAGGGLAACLSQRIVDQGEIQPAAQLLIYPMLDDRTATETSYDSLNHFLWNNRNNRLGWKSYLGEENFGKPEMPDYLVAARRKDLTGLPPAWIGVGDMDLFYKEDQQYAARLEACGVVAQLEIIAGAPHGFDELAKESRKAEIFRSSSLQFLEQQLG